jgi:type II secretory pathway pseudopilin PulG
VSPSRSEAGFSLVALAAGVTIMLIMMGAAVPSWQYVMKDMREEELIFRGGQIADAISRYQQKNGNAAPPSLEVLVKGKFLRKEYKDPFAKDGKWRLIRQGEMVNPAGPTIGGGPGGGPGVGPSPAASPSPSPSPGSSGPGVGTGTSFGPIMGVASTSKEKSLRIFNGRTRYDEWLFIAGQPRIVGRHPGAGLGRPPGASPGTRPSASPGTRR